MKYAYVALATKALLLASAASAMAQSAPPRREPDVRPAAVDDVEVVAQNLEQTLPLTLAQYGSPLEIVTAKQIKDSGFIDVVQALELLVPGVTVSTQAGAFSYANISLQGSRNSDVLWTIDGVRIGNRLYNSTSPADTLPASMVERVEVLKGGQGLFYGTQAVAGVINVVTRPFTEEWKGAVSAGLDSNDGSHLNGSVGGGVGRHRVVLWGSRDQSDGYELYDAYQPNTDLKNRTYDVRSLGLKYGYAFTDDLHLTAQYILTDAKLDYPSVRGVSVNDRKETIAIGRLDYTPSDRVQLYLKAYHHQWDTDYYTRPAPSAYWGYEDFGLNAMAELKLNKGLAYTVGYEFQNYRGRDDVLLIAGETEQVHAAFGQIRTTDDFSRKLRLAAGLRVNSTPKTDSTVWNLSGAYDITDNLHFDAMVGTSFLLPDAQQLYGIDDCCARGNLALKPEESFNINVGLSGRIGDQAWLISGWDRRIDNLITTDASNPPAGYPSLFVNIDAEVKARGFEVTTRGPLGAGFNYLLSYTYSQERARGTNVQIAGRPEHSGKATLSWRSEGPFGADLSAKYIGQTESVVSGFGTQAYGDYWVANLGGHVWLDPSNRTRRLNVRVENLFDTNYATSVASAVLTGSSPSTRFLYHRLGAPRTFYVSLSQSF